MDTRKILAVAMLLIVIASCTPKTQSGNLPVGTKVSQVKFDSDVEPTQELKKFSSPEELAAFLEEMQNRGGAGDDFYGGIGRNSVMSATAESGGMKAGAPAPAMDADGGAGASDYSQTNVQVAGVDEADFVKNDGKYIYTLVQDKLVIVEAYPVDNAKIVSQTELKSYPTNLFLNGDRLVVLANGNEEILRIAEYDYMPKPWYTSRAHVYVYDITDKAKPELIKDYSVSGSYYDARMIGDYVYMVSSDYVYYYNRHVETPVVYSSGKEIMRPDIYYFDNPEYNYNFMTVSAINVKNEEDDIKSKSFMMGYATTMYVSQDSLYLAYQRNQPWWHWQDESESRFYEVVVPNLPQNVQSQINDIKGSDDKPYEKWQKISSVLEDMYNNMDKDARDELVEDIAKKIEEYEIKRQIELRKTIIQKITIKDGQVEYDTKGEVDGYLHNQFSMDEFEGDLRVATTVQAWGMNQPVAYNNVYVLDEDMKTIGSLEDIAPDETIYSTRFIGERLYMVTFKRIDPFFVIDLSNPSKPKVLGELKIPGYSDYLHPYDEDHIIGIGKETGSNEWGGVSTKGIKVALFDVSNVEKPELVESYEIGSAGSDSEALNDHKAFLFDKKRNMVVIPATEVKGERIFDTKYGYYRNRIWQGAYVLSVSPKDGISSLGRITHMESVEDEWNYWSSPYTVRRSLFMDDVLYTVSSSMIKMNDIDDVDEELKSIDLPYKEPYYGGYPTPYPVDVRAEKIAVDLPVME